MKYSITAKSDLQVEQTIYKSGDFIGEITTDLRIDHLQSLLDVRMLSVLPPESVSRPAEDELNDEAPVSGPPVTEPILASPGQPEQTPEEKAAIEFPGLKSRIALALMGQGIANAEALAEYVDAEKDLEDLPEIGKTAKQAILDWLAKN